MVRTTLLIFVVLLVSSSNAELTNLTFPKDFLFGVATASYQIEGAWNVDGKGENIWDRFTHSNASRIKNGDTGDVACDSYHKFDQDVALAKELGVKHYRFSVSWSRILPNGLYTPVNAKGIYYYQELVRQIVSAGMIPVVTLYHWDLPQPLQDLQGWVNPELVHHFVNYSRIVIESLDQVGYWITINEPKQICRRGYGDGSFAPGVKLDGIGEYLCAYVVAKAHAAVYRMFKEEFPDSKAKMSITMDGEWSEPASDSKADVEAAERRNQFEFGLYANPIFDGNWPQVVIDRVKYRSEKENFTKSRLPEFTEEEIKFINGTYDFMGFNTYWTYLVGDLPESDFGQVGYLNDIRANTSVDPTWSIAHNGNPIVPWGARKFLKWVKETYNDPEVFITENGISDSGASLQDRQRINFFTDYLAAIWQAMNEDQVKVFGYTAWSLLDNFEWTDGYSEHFGLYSVNFSDPNRARTAKESANFYKNLAATHQLVADIAPATSTTESSTITTTITTSTSTPDNNTATTTLPESTTRGSGSRLVVYKIVILIVCIIYLL